MKHPLSCLIYYIQYMPRLQVMAHWRVLLWVQATSSLSNSSAAKIKLRKSPIPLLYLFNRLSSASLFLFFSFSSRATALVSRVSRLCLSTLALACTTLSKSEEKRDSSQSSVNYGDVTRDDSPRRFLAQHSAAMLGQCCNHSQQCCNALLGLKSSLRIVSCNVTLRQSGQSEATNPPQKMGTWCDFQIL